MEDAEDQRDIELSSLSAIFPEIQRVHDDDPYTIVLEVPINPSNGVVVSFPPAATDGIAPSANGVVPADLAIAAHHAMNTNDDSEEQRLSYLPPISLQISLSPGYPTEEPPSISISTSPPWLPDDVVRRLEEDGPRLWEEMGRDIVVFTYIDHVQQSAEDLFGLVNEKDALQVDLQHKISILDYDIKAKRSAFERKTFECGVCLDPKKGSVCHRMLDCGHVFCVECLQDFYNNAIKEGDLATVRCLAPNCAKEREEKAVQGRKSRGKKVRTFISPSELLQIPLDQEVVKRYVTLKYKTELESDKNTIYCPRSWCNGAARSKKHRKPEGLELAEAASDDDSDADDESDTKPKPRKPTSEDLVAICEDCGFAFCSRCRQSWHGEFYVCQGPRNTEEISEEEKASLEYVRLHSTPCPQCGAPAQKTHGCNHMICYRCRSHFCYLCSAWLDPANPYQHFNEMPGGKVTGCYMRLWELENGDGDDVDYGFAGGVRRPEPQQEQARPAVEEEARVVAVIEEPDEELVEREEIVFAQRRRDGENRNNDRAQNGAPVAVAREGPLVLRITGNQPAGAGRGGPRGGHGGHAPPPAVPAGPARGGRQPLRGGQAGARGGRGGGGGAAGARVGAAGGDGRRGNAGRGGAPNRQNNRGGGRGAQRHNAAAPAHGAVHANDNHGHRGGDVEHFEVEGGGDLDAVQRAWVRRFVQLALNDQEDVLLGFDSDSD